MPRRMGREYKHPFRVVWTDKYTGKKRRRAFTWSHSVYDWVHYLTINHTDKASIEVLRLNKTDGTWTSMPLEEVMRL